MKELLQQYQKDAAKTINTHLSYDKRLMEMGLGLCGEAAELKKILNSNMTKEEFREEMVNEGGDISWYAAALCTLHKREFSEVVPDEIQPYPLSIAADKVVIAAGDIADAIKKAVAQGHKLDLDSIYSHLTDLVSNLAVLLSFFGIDYEEVLAYNNLKLQKRYPNGKFETSRSVNRELQQ